MSWVFSDVVSMREEETFSSDFGYQGSVVYRNAQFMREIIENPNVVVPDKPVYVNAVVTQLGQLAEKRVNPLGTTYRYSYQ